MEKKIPLYASAITPAEQDTLRALKKAGVFVGVELREHTQEYGPSPFYDVLYFTLDPKGL